MTNKLINSYLFNYVRSLRAHDLEKQYQSIINFKGKIIKFLAYKQQRGGTLTEKVNKIHQVAALYKDIDKFDVEKNRKEIESNLEELEKKIDSSHKKILDTERYLVDNKIMTTIETLAFNITDMKNNFNILPETVNLYLPVELASIKVPNDEYSFYVAIAKEFQGKLKRLNAALVDSSVDLRKMREEQVRRIEVEIKNITKPISEVDSVLKSLREANMTFEKGLSFDVKDADIVRIIDIKRLIDMIKKALGDAALMTGATGPLLRDFNESTLKKYEAPGKKTMRDSHFIDLYNQMVAQFDRESLARTSLPSPYFDGGYVIRVSNNLLVSPKIAAGQLSQLNKLISVAPGDILYREFTPQKELKIQEIYEPDFKKYQTGGSLEERLSDFEAKKVELGAKLEQYETEIKKYNSYQLYQVTHTLFLSLIATNQILIDGYTIYVFVNQGLLEFFKMILTNINTKIDAHEKTEDILYLRKYHYVTIKKLFKFVTDVSKAITSKDIIDIRACKGDVAEGFLLLNYFKTVLESYNEMFQNKITIYSRINDIGDKEYFNAERKSGNVHTFFISDKQKNKPGDPSLMWIQKKAAACSSIAVGPDEDIKFTQVYDSENFASNVDISKYMTLDTQLAKGKSVSLMTYGYSGTGKTYTLFGKKSVDTTEDGLLQFTIDNINGLKLINFRVFEIYGCGLAYPYYWTKTDTTGRTTSRLDDIYHQIYRYNLQLEEATIQFNCVEIIPAKKIKEFTAHSRNLRDMSKQTYKQRKETSPSYTEIVGKLTSKVLKNFDCFVGNIENHRENKMVNFNCSEANPTEHMKIRETNNCSEPGTGSLTRERIRRIRDTPNNTVSSRSILVYDFQLYIDDMDAKQPVQFLIIDLPGREEIIPTYVDMYLGKEGVDTVIKKILLGSEEKEAIITKGDKLLRYQMLLAVMCINPVAVPIFNMKSANNRYLTIYEKIKLSNKEILDAVIEMKFYYMDTSVGGVDNPQLKAMKDKYEMTQDVGSRRYTVDSRKGINGFKFEDELINLKGWSIGRVLKAVDNDNPKKNTPFDGWGYLYPDYTNSQAFALLSIHVMNRLILLNRFDIIEKIYEEICRYEINGPIDEYVGKIKSAEDIYDDLKSLSDMRFKGDFIELVRNKATNAPELPGLVTRIVRSPDRAGIAKEIGKNILNIKKDLKNILHYDYYLTPFEGIYINENIIGLTKYLSEKTIVATTAAEIKDKDEFINEKIKKQDTKLNFSYQQKVARVWLISDRTKGKADIKDFYDFADIASVPLNLYREKAGGGIELNYDNLRKEYWGIVDEKGEVKKPGFRDAYKSDHIFNFDNPLIEAILEPYINKVPYAPAAVIVGDKNKDNSIKDFKVFYLFANYAETTIRDMKCLNQYNLLKNTKDFIEMIVGEKKV
ncbi:MAG: hypothetical protein Hyperionvirus17_13 [Hyperionvirus sp.]|uniref:Kinesin motor domain-containing protein n=1 Tax=Hyperionvirus sp. TaxID=2487770 RepID=A0A3G5ADZ3_9VIRU|nr:MAG: hypothetical protein Hyperionvirus17_13 [Hyperionvirus sp.]